MDILIFNAIFRANLGLCDRSPRIAKSPRKPLANPSYANLGVIEALASTDARRGIVKVANLKTSRIYARTD